MVILIQSSDCIVLPQLLHRDPAHRPRSRAGHSCEQQLVRRLTFALDAAAQGCAAKGGIVAIVVTVLIAIVIVIVVLLCTQIRHPHRLHIHHEAEAVQPCQLRQLATCHHHLPRPFTVFEALHVQVGDEGKACGLRLPLAAAQPVAQLAARAGAPRRAHRLEPAQSRGIRLLKRGLEHIWARQRGRLLRRLLWLRWREGRLGERCRQLRLAHVILRAEVRAQLLDALASKEANVQLTGGSTEGAGRIEIVGTCHHSDELLERVRCHT
eukprot:scaffold2480_cov65-Phaeocystis_antarctica.AAC.3